MLALSFKMYRYTSLKFGQICMSEFVHAIPRNHTRIIPWLYTEKIQSAIRSHYNVFPSIFQATQLIENVLVYFGRVGQSLGKQGFFSTNPLLIQCGNDWEWQKVPSIFHILHIGNTKGRPYLGNLYILIGFVIV